MALTFTDLFPGLTKASDNTSITIPAADLEGLTAAEIGAGDGRKLAYALFQKMQSQLASDPSRSTRFTLTASDPTTVGPTTVRKTYSAAFTLDFSVSDVSNEPA